MSNYLNILKNKIFIFFMLLVLLVLIIYIIMLNLPIANLQVISPENISLKTNNKQLNNGNNWLRPGNYEVLANGPYIEKKYELNINVFKKNILVVDKSENNIDEISVVKKAFFDRGIGFSAIDQCKDFDEKWLICRLNSGSAVPIALEYTNQSSWQLYFKPDIINNNQALDYFNQIKNANIRN